ncbi:MAG: hypothetical protein O7E52_13280 [Candidatus Poribacteria bacterium]|nr:hypothetical protein [Candidatus Poribacteria bacterium]
MSDANVKNKMKRKWGHIFIIDKRLSFFFQASAYINSNHLAYRLTHAGRPIPKLQLTKHCRLKSEAKKSALKSVVFENGGNPDSSILYEGVAQNVVSAVAVRFSSSTVMSSLRLGTERSMAKLIKADFVNNEDMTPFGVPVWGAPFGVPVWGASPGHPEEFAQGFLLVGNTGEQGLKQGTYRGGGPSKGSCILYLI